MEHWFFNDIISFFVSVLFAGTIIPQILRIAFRNKIFDSVDQRKIHNARVPRLGGIAFFPTILFSVSVVLAFNLKYFIWDMPLMDYDLLLSLLFLVCAVLVMYLLGIADDLLGVKYYMKFAFQVLSAIFIVFSGIYIQDFFGFIWIHHIYDWIGWILTGIMVLYVVNAINLIDGIDGLASGLSSLAFFYYAIIFFYADKPVFSLLACASLGTLLPFFYFNVFGKTRNHKKIFMGDTGSLTIGMIIVFCGFGMLHLGDVALAEDYNPVILAISPLLIPMFDLLRVFINRLVKGKNPFMPDKTHVHHRLMALGLSQRVTLAFIMLWSMFFILINMLLSEYINPTFIIIADVAVWCIVNIFISKYISIRKAKESLTEPDKNSIT